VTSPRDISSLLQCLCFFLFLSVCMHDLVVIQAFCAVPFCLFPVLSSGLLTPISLFSI
jgi:hypothetical protein